MIMQELYRKWLNVLIHGVKEDIWEKREDTILKFNNLLKNGLKIDDPDGIDLVNVHRLPQHPLMKNGKGITRPTSPNCSTCKIKAVFAISKTSKNLQRKTQRRRQ